MRQLTSKELSVVHDVNQTPDGVRLTELPLLILVGLTGAGKTTTVARLLEDLAIDALLPDRRALTDEVILPMMVEDGSAVADRVARFRLTAAFKERHRGGMGDVLHWLVAPSELADGRLLFDGLRGEAEVAAAAAMPRARFVVLDCAPEERLWRLCGRNDPFDQIGGCSGGEATTRPDAQPIRTALGEHGFDALVSGSTLDRLIQALVDQAIEPADIARASAIIAEESRHYDPAAAVAALMRSAPDRTLVIDTATTKPAAVSAAVAAWWPEMAGR